MRGGLGVEESVEGVAESENGLGWADLTIEKNIRHGCVHGWVYVGL